jgi:hypothetical protein
MKNRNEITTINSKYIRQQEIINKVCKDYNLCAYRPNYHAKDRDCNTVLIYNKEDEIYNNELEKTGETRTEAYKKPLFTFENTDINGMFSLDFANRGKLDLRIINEDLIIETAIKEAMQV